MKGVNKVILVGNVGRDPEVRYSKGGDAVCSLSLATSRKWVDKATGERQEQTEWHRLVAFKKGAEVLGEYVTKGDPLYVEGELQTRKWQDQSGQDRYTTEVVVRDFTLLGGGGGSGGQGSSQGAASLPGGEGGGWADDDIPF